LKIRGILTYQFDSKVAEALLSPQEDLEVITTSKNRIRYVLKGGVRILTLRPSSGTFTLSLEAARILLRVSEPPRFRVIVRGDREIRGSVLARDVVNADPNIRPDDEVVVVNTEDELIGVGRAKVAGDLMKEVTYGEVVRLRATAKS